MSLQSPPDRAIERLLKASLATPSHAPTGPCLDAETLAAWVDGALTGDPLAAAQTHAADCAVCQAMLAAMARTAPPAVAPEPWWRRSLSARWLVPMAATATALAIWVAVPRNEYVAAPKPESAASARSDASQMEGARESSAAVEAPAESDSTGARAPLQGPVPAEPQLKANESSTGATSGAREVPSARRDETAGAADLRSGLDPQTTAPAENRLQSAESQATAGAGQTAASQPMAPAAASPQTQSPAALGRAAAPAPERTAASPAPADTRNRQFSVLQERVADAPAAQIASPNSGARWRIGPRGAVEYSANGGGTWQATASGVTVDLVAGASPSGTVCWIVGRAGTVLLTTDGRQWRRLTAPTAMDIVGIEATDARTATVTSADGQRFTTTDAGATWR